MLRTAITFLLVFTALNSARAADAEFIRVWPQWRDTASFERIGEFFGAPENNGREIVLRTHPQNRDGYYFLVRVKHAVSLAGATFALHVIRPDAPDARVFTPSGPAKPFSSSASPAPIGRAAKAPSPSPGNSSSSPSTSTCSSPKKVSCGRNRRSEAQPVDFVVWSN
jgi:hypothetical protein